MTAPLMRSPVVRLPLPRVTLRRRALVGAAWALAWTLVWASALMMFATKASAQALSLAVVDGPACVADAHALDPLRVIAPGPPRKAAPDAVGFVQ